MREKGDEGRLQRERDDLQQRDDEGDEGAGDDGAEGDEGTEGDEETTALRLRERGAFSLMKKMWETRCREGETDLQKMPVVFT
ncbi:hypothetical protein OIU77_006472 [Salix suchowensis]|uniref:Uncharacterized protein n=1 Tax=Salix suchowensis TaxID=1278906 RepID=A0ABQ9ALR8_9ROSI|nr:hypothetical protein OIU77_006472 [Salix suchowensis]